MEENALDDVIANIGAPVYGVVGWRGSRRIRGWGSGNGTWRLNLSHEAADVFKRQSLPSIDVLSTVWGTASALRVETSWMLRRWIGHFVHLNVQADDWSERLQVEGAPHPFEFVGTREDWLAEAIVGSRTVTVTATGVRTIRTSSWER